MIELLAKNNDKWLAMARNICKNTDQANEIVQEMYLKLYDLNKQVNEAYVYFTLKSIYHNLFLSKKAKKEISIDNYLLPVAHDDEIDYLKEEKLNQIS